MIREIARGLGLQASTWMDGPAPGPGIPGFMSSPGRSQNYLGNIALVPMLGHQRYATYRAIYLTNPWCFAAISMKADAIARTPLQVYALDAKGRKQRQRGDLPLTPGRPSGPQQLDRLLSNPSTISRHSFFKSTMTDKLTNGNGLWRIDRAYGDGTPTGLTLIPWRSVARVDYDTRGPIPSVNYYELRRSPADLNPIRLGTKDVVHFGLGSDPETPLGISPLESCSATLALHDAVMRHLLGYFSNSARLSGHLTLDKLTKENAPEIRQMITEMYTSPENAGKVLVTGQGQWTSISDSPSSAQVVELIAQSREEVAAAYQIPPPLLGILDRAIKANVYELRNQYIRDAVGSDTAMFQDELQAQLLTQTPSWGSLYTEFQLADQLRPDIEARAMVYQRLMMYFTIDEIRGFENLLPLDIPGISDVTWVPSGAQPLSAFLAGGAKKLPGQAPVPSDPLALDWEEITRRLAMLEAAGSTNGHEPALV